VIHTVFYSLRSRIANMPSALSDVNPPSLIYDFKSESKCSAYATMQLIPILLYSCYAYTLLVMGVYALATNYRVIDNVCGKEYHLFKFCFCNIVLWLFSIVSYCVWRGGSESSRARAVLLTVLHFGALMWGAMLWTSMSDSCSSVLNKQFHAIYAFQKVCTCTNGLVFTLMFIHESFLGKKLGVDFTIMAQVNWTHKPVNYLHQKHDDMLRAPHPPPKQFFLDEKADSMHKGYHKGHPATVPLPNGPTDQSISINRTMGQNIP